jgi:hypothetical protein
MMIQSANQAAGAEGTSHISIKTPGETQSAQPTNLNFFIAV